MRYTFLSEEHPPITVDTATDTVTFGGPGVVVDMVGGEFADPLGTRYRFRGPAPGDRYATLDALGWSVAAVARGDSPR